MSHWNCHSAIVGLLQISKCGVTLQGSEIPCNLLSALHLAVDIRSVGRLRPDIAIMVTHAHLLMAGEYSCAADFSYG